MFKSLFEPKVNDDGNDKFEKQRQSENEKLKQGLKDAENKIKQANDITAQWQDKYKRTKKKLTTSDNMLNIANDRIKALEAKLTKERNQHKESVRKLNQEHNEEISQLKVKHKKDIKTAVKHYKGEVKRLEKELSTAKSEKKDAEDQLFLLTTKMSKANEKNNKFTDYANERLSAIANIELPKAPPQFSDDEDDNALYSNQNFNSSQTTYRGSKYGKFTDFMDDKSAINAGVDYHESKEETFSDDDSDNRQLHLMARKSSNNESIMDKYQTKKSSDINDDEQEILYMEDIGNEREQNSAPPVFSNEMQEYDKNEILKGRIKYDKHDKLGDNEKRASSLPPQFSDDEESLLINQAYFQPRNVAPTIFNRNVNVGNLNNAELLEPKADSNENTHAAPIMAMGGYNSDQ